MSVIALSSCAATFVLSAATTAAKRYVLIVSMRVSTAVLARAVAAGEPG